MRPRMYCSTKLVFSPFVKIWAVARHVGIRDGWGDLSRLPDSALLPRWDPSWGSTDQDILLLSHRIADFLVLCRTARLIRKGGDLS